MTIKVHYILSLSTLLLSSCGSIRPVSRSTENSPTAIMNRFVATEREKDMQNILDGKDSAQKLDFLQKVDNKLIDMWIKYFTSRGRADFQRYMNNGEKYRELIEKILVDYGLPKELYFVGMIESGYSLHAKSSASAVGPWQFIKSTGVRYGLKVQNELDERRNIEKSTIAAALFFQDLYNIFGSWELALSAYNAGEYGVIKRIRHAKTRDFYELSEMKKLPKETRHYVPKVIAAMEIYNNYKKYNFYKLDQKNLYYENTEQINIKQSVDLNFIAKSTNSTVSKIKELNPELISSRVPYVAKNGVTLRVPSSKKNLLLANLRTYKKDFNDTGFYKIKRGDNLLKISKKFNISLSELKTINNMSKNTIYIGQKIRVPSSVASNISIDASPKKFEIYKVKKGDNLYSIARTYHTSLSGILKLNKTNNKTIYIGQKLKVPSVDRTYYVVKSGDFLEKIAKIHGVSVKEIRDLNTLTNSKIFPGQRLIVKEN